MEVLAKLGLSSKQSLEELTPSARNREPMSRETELEQDKRACLHQRRMRSATRQELKARQGLSGGSMTSLADTLAAQADEQAAKNDTSR
jgi:hypothetical protein